MSAVDRTVREVVRRLVNTAFGPDVVVASVADAGGGRGVFSDVLRLTLDLEAPKHSASSVAGSPRPPTVVAKLPAQNDNGRAAVASGAVAREAFAYTHVLTDDAGIQHPELLALDTVGDSTAFLFQDLGDHRAVDQLAGLGADDTIAVVEALGAFHRRGRPPSHETVRRNTPATFDVSRLRTGLALLGPTWELADADIEPFDRMLTGWPGLIERFDDLRPTLCHGDVRADNLVFDDRGRPVLFDWQQIAVQTGGADVAWLLATSLEPALRQAVTDSVVETYAGTAGIRPAEAREAVRLGVLLPGSAVLMLAQRQPDSERTAAFIRTSIKRISHALADAELT